MPRKIMAKKKVYRKPKQSLMSLTNKVNSLIKKSMELNHHDTNSLFIAVSNSPSINDVSQLLQGLGDTLRTSDKIHLKNFQASLTIKNETGASATNNNIMRCSVIQWLDDDTFNPPTANQIYQDSSNYQSFFNKDSLVKGTFKILYDKKYTTTLSGDTQVRQVKFFLDLKGKHIEYSNNAVYGRGKIYVIFISDSSTTPNPTVGYAFRMMYYE